MSAPVRLPIYDNAEEHAVFTAPLLGTEKKTHIKDITREKKKYIKYKYMYKYEGSLESGYAVRRDEFTVFSQDDERE